MRIMGINICETSVGLKLWDGGCAILEDGELIVAISEERLTRKKYDGDVKESFNYCLSSAGLAQDDIDLFVLSVCCDVPLTMDHAQKILMKNDICIPDKKTHLTSSHHLAHAACSFFSSPFEKAIILVMDNEGNILGERKDVEHWANSLERISVFIGDGININLLERYCDDAGDLGIGDVYAYFTHAVGFKTNKDAGKTMGLAAHGTPRFSNVNSFKFENGKPICLLEPIHDKRSLAVRRLLFKQSGVDVGTFSEVGDNPSQDQKDMAWCVQNISESAIFTIIETLIERTGIDNFCIGGGVGLNCVVNGKILKKTRAKALHVPPCVDDTGLAIGDALFGYHLIEKQERQFEFKDTSLGKTYTDQEILSSAELFPGKINYVKSSTICRDVAVLIRGGKVVAWFQGGSEIGPRALGYRSILADPQRSDMKDHLNRNVKYREGFRPYGASVLSEFASDIFDVIGTSPFMLQTVGVRKEFHNKLPAITHVDGSCRIQTVQKDLQPKYHELITEFQKLTNVPLVLNTSFNLAGEPIVESPADAMNTFVKSNIDYLAIGDYLFEKSASKVLSP